MGRIKQVILIRRDLHMRRGKEIAQGSHAAMGFLIARIRQAESAALDALQLNDAERTWLFEGMAKVCLQVQSEEDLLHFHNAAEAAGLNSFLVRDSGRTEFDGVPTLTACAIGPADADQIDTITGELKLY